MQIFRQTVILVDHGIATGCSMRAAFAALRLHKVGRILAAVPVAPHRVCEELRACVGEFVYLTEAKSFLAVQQ